MTHPPHSNRLLSLDLAVIAECLGLSWYFRIKIKSFIEHLQISQCLSVSDEMTNCCTIIIRRCLLWSPSQFSLTPDTLNMSSTSLWVTLSPRDTDHHDLLLRAERALHLPLPAESPGRLALRLPHHGPRRGPGLAPALPGPVLPPQTPPHRAHRRSQWGGSQPGDGGRRGCHWSQHYWGCHKQHLKSFIQQEQGQSQGWEHILTTLRITTTNFFSWKLRPRRRENTPRYDPGLRPLQVWAEANSKWGSRKRGVCPNQRFLNGGWKLC